MTPDPRLDAIRRVIRDGYPNTAHDMLAEMQDDWETSDEPRAPDRAYGYDSSSLLNIVAVVIGLVFLAVIIYLSSVDRLALEDEEAMVQLTVAAITPRALVDVPRVVGGAPSGISPGLPASTPAVRGAGNAGALPTPESRVYPDQEAVAHVVRALSVDQIEVEIGGETFRVVYLGIAGPLEGARCYEAATSFHERLVAGRTVRLVRDVVDTDSAGRLLRYVYIEGSMLNAMLLRAGYAMLLTQLPNDRFLSDLERAEAEGRRLATGCYRTGGFGQASPPSAASGAQAALCNRNTCWDFQTRAELNDYLAICPQDFWKFDLDGDGTPCWNREDAP